MSELYVNMGFKENPFSRYSAEEELEYLNDIFNPPKYYDTVYTDISKGNSRFIFGERGVGKTALMIKLKDTLEKNDVFTVFIDEYESISLENNEKDFLIEVLRKIVSKFSIEMLKKPMYIKKLNNSHKESLSLFITLFFSPISKKDFIDTYNKASGLKKKNICKKISNYFLLKPVNTIISGVSEVISSTISNSLGLPPVTNSDFYKEYVKEFTIKDVSSQEEINEAVSKLDYKKLKNMLSSLQEMLEACDFKNIVIFFDKIDEYSKLGGNIKKISQFVKNIINDTTLLHMKNISFVFGIWGRVSYELNRLGLRFDKFKPIDINWSTDDLNSIINLRLKFFSSNKIELSNLVSQKWEKKILDMANNSPRHLIMLLDRIYDEQSIIDCCSKEFSDRAIELGIEKFIKNFDYNSLYPGNKEENNYIINVINRTLRVGKVDFKQKDVKDKLRLSNAQAEEEIETMKNFALVNDCLGTARGKRFNIIDPKIKYLINRGIKEFN